MKPNTKNGYGLICSDVVMDEAITLQAKGVYYYYYLIKGDLHE
jgi:hypothetical protein